MGIKLIMIMCSRNPILLIAFICIKTTLCESSNVNVNITQPKVIGGSVVDNRSYFPFLVSIRKNGYHFCGGSIISSRHVLTATHCFYDYLKNQFKLSTNLREFSVVAGSLVITYDPNAINRKINRIFLHNKYNAESMIGDIAIIEIEKSFLPWTKYVNYINLASKSYSEMCTTCGWGVTNFESENLSKKLMAVNLPIVSKRECRLDYGKSIKDDMICAGGKGLDSCQGDSGGPLVCLSELQGIVSWGVSCGIYPGVYTSVPKYKDWVQAIIKNTNSARGLILSESKILLFTSYILYLLLA